MVHHCPCWCNRAEGYARKLKCHVNGLQVGYVEKDGSFEDTSYDEQTRFEQKARTKV